MFSEAARVLTSLLRGEKLPKVSDGGFRTVENKTVFPCCLQDNLMLFRFAFVHVIYAVHCLNVEHLILRRNLRQFSITRNLL